MDITATVDSEQLRDIMSELLWCSTDVARRYGGIVDKFTGSPRLGASPNTLENDFTVGFARFTRGLALIRHDSAGSGPGFDRLAAVHKSIAQERLSMTLSAIDAHLARAIST
jgi:hypothetical protein